MSDKEFITRVLCEDDAARAIRREQEKLCRIIPELENMIGFDQRHPHHHLDLWEHTTLAISRSENDLKTRLALLLHDVGKPRSFTEEKGVRHYMGHPAVSAKIAEARLGALDFDQGFIKEISRLILLHDRPITSALVREDPDFSRDLFKIQICDVLAHNPLYNQKRLDYIEGCKAEFGFE